MKDEEEIKNFITHLRYCNTKNADAFPGPDDEPVINDIYTAIDVLDWVMDG